MTALVGPAAERETERLLDQDPTRHVVVLANSEAEIHGVGEFVIDHSGTGAELAMVVEDQLQGQGTGQRLYGYLEQLARQHGITQFTGDVAHGNRLVLRMLRDTGRPLRLEHGYGCVRFTLALEQ